MTVGGRVWREGDKCDVLDRYAHRLDRDKSSLREEWREGRIEIIKPGTAEAFISFDGWNKRDNKWINFGREPGRLAPAKARTQVSHQQAVARTTTFEGALREQGLQVVRMLGDGNCLFRAVAHQIFGNPERHAQVRRAVCDYMLDNREDFEMVLGALVPGPNGFDR